MKKKPIKHIFVCTNKREGKSKSCGNKGFKIRTKLVGLLGKSSKKDKIRINKSGCLGLCKSGPCMVIYPQKIWYEKIKIKNCEEIFNKSIIDNDIIKDLQVPNERWDK